MTVKLSEEYKDTVIAIAAKNGLPAGLLVSLLDLELDYPNLHGYGQRPALKRSIAELLEKHFAATADSDKQDK